MSQWSPINGQIVGTSADVVVNPSSAAQATQAVVDALNDGDPHAIFVHFDDPDYAGHAYGFSPFVFPYLDAIEAMDVLIGQMMAAMEARPNYAEEDWLVLVTTDHGGIGTTHGGNSMEERRVFVIASGESVATTVERDTLSVIGVQRTVLGMRPGSRLMAIPERRCRQIPISCRAPMGTSRWSAGCGRRRLRMWPWWATRIGTLD